MRDNITLNAYLIPMMTDALRDEMLQLCKDADIDILSHVYPSTPWVAESHTFKWYKAAMEDCDRYGLKLLTRDVDVMNALNQSDEQLRKIAEIRQGFYKHIRDRKRRQSILIGYGQIKRIGAVCVLRGGAGIDRREKSEPIIIKIVGGIV